MNQIVTQVNIGQTKLRFGRGAVKSIAEELLNLKAGKPLIITDHFLSESGLLKAVTKPLQAAEIPFLIFDGVEADPKGSEVDAAVMYLKEEECDCVIGFGGGSVMDVAKCTAAMATNEGRLMDYDHAGISYKEFSRISLPLINIPTTSGTGSELSPYAVITNEEQGRKATIGSSSLLSRVALVDPEMVLKLPPHVTASTGADALTHCIEAFTTVKSLASPNPIIDALALKALGFLFHNLPKAYSEGSDYSAREKVMWGSVIGGFVLQYGSGASHGLGNVLGGEYHIPHGQAVGMLLPYVMEFNLDVCGERYEEIARALGVENAKSLPAAVGRLLREMDFPRLSKYISDPEDFGRLSELACKDKCTRINGKPLTEKDAAAIYRRAL